MSRGSEQIRRSWLRGVTVFDCCGEPIKRLSDVSETRYEHPSERTRVVCMACRIAKVAERVARERA